LVICKIRKIKESDIPTLYQMLKESLSQKYTSVYDTELPSFKQSSNYVKKFLKGSKNHEFEQWYVIINEKKEIMVLGQNAHSRLQTLVVSMSKWIGKSLT